MKLSKKDVEAILPLTAAQMGMLVESLAMPDRGLHIEQVVLDLEGDVDPKTLERAWRRMVERHDVFRTAFLGKTRDEPLQAILRSVPAKLETEDLRELSEAEREARVEAHMRDARRRVHLARPPLSRWLLLHVGPASWKLMWTFHHVLLDGWCQSQFLHELFTTYRALTRGGEPDLPPARPYQDYVRWFHRRDAEQDRDFWRRALAPWQEPTAPGVPTEGSEPSVDGFGETSMTLAAREATGLEALARRLQATLNVLLQGVWAFLLDRWNRHPASVTFGATVSGRPPELSGVESTLGLFINTLPVCLGVPRRGSFATWLEEVRDWNLELRQHEQTSAADLYEWCELPAAVPLFESLLVFQNRPRTRQGTLGDAAGLTIRHDRSEGARTRYPVTLMFEPGEDLVVRLVYDPSRLGDADAWRMLEQIRETLTTLVTHPDCDFRDLDEMISRTEPPRVRVRSQNAKDPTAEDLPATAMERQVAEAFARVLDVRGDALTRDSGFFELGGHSLAALRLAAELETQTGVRVPLVELLRRGTVQSIAAHLDDVAPGARDAEASEKTGARGDVSEAEPLQPDPARWSEPFPLTELQEAYWVGAGGAFDLGVAPRAYVELAMPGLDPARLEVALETLVERHGMLRAVVTADGQQRILSEAPPLDPEPLDLRILSATERQERLEALRREMSMRPPAVEEPLFEVRLTRLENDLYHMHFGFSLLIVDAASVGIFFDELMAAYRVPDGELAPMELSFRDYVLALPSLRGSESRRRAESYWRRRLDTLPPAPELPRVAGTGDLGPQPLTRYQGELDPARWQRLRERAARWGVTPTALLCAIYAEAVGTWSKTSHFTLNVLLSDRRPVHPQMNRLLGNCSTTLLLEVDRGPQQPFEHRVQRLQRQLWNDLEHRDVSGIWVLRELHRRHRAAAMPVVFTSALDAGGGEETRRVLQGGDSGLELEEVETSVQTPQVWLDHQVGPRPGGGLGYNFDFVAALFPPGLMDDLITAYRDLLEGLADAQEPWKAIRPCRVPQHQLEARRAVERAAAEAPPAPPVRLYEPFEQNAAAAPDRPAVIAAERTLSYGELAGEARRLAHDLRRRGVEPNRLVAVVMEKGWEQIVAVLAIQMAGGAYLPIDPSLPGARVDHLLDAGRVEIALTQPRLLERLEWPAGVEPRSVERPGVDEENEMIPPLEPIQELDDLAYVIFTSGSTGVPKGVMIDHRGALNTIVDVNRRFDIGPDDRVLALSALSFDLSVYDVFGLLAAGGGIVLPAPGDSREPESWRVLLEEQRVTVWNTVPALMEMLVGYLEGRSQPLPGTLSRILLSGDWIPTSLPGRIRDLHPGDVAVTSLGGATEASVWSIFHPVEGQDPSWSSIPYGRPLGRQSVRVLDGALEPRPDWVAGDLYIGGLGVARGYWRDEEKTRASFVFHSSTGERLYRTGDLGRFRPGGDIEFLGREDSQVKIQGYRIELGEIEAALAEHPDLRAVVVEAVGEAQSGRRLVAYGVVEEDVEEAPDLRGIREHLTHRIPEYMLPTAFVPLDDLPLTPNGKVDRAALPAPDQASARSRDPRPPMGETERELARIWRELLDVDEVLRQDDFFALGGHSLTAVRLMERIRRRFGRELSLSVLFEAPTVEHLARAVEGPMDAEDGCLVRLGTVGGAPQRLFLVHPVGGGVFGYLPLARQLEGEVLIYGIQDPALAGEAVPRGGLPALAEHYLQHVRRLQPEGPYLLGGWSFGGVVAFEMARRLEQRGIQGGSLFLLDPATVGSEALAEAELAVWFAHDLARVSGVEPSRSSINLPADADSTDVLQHLHAAGLLSDELEPKDLVRRYEVFQRHARELTDYRPEPYGGSLVLVRAEGSGAGVGLGATDTWMDWVRGDVEVHRLEADHYTLLEDFRVARVAEILREHLHPRLSPRTSTRSKQGVETT